jgi:hypothetical protein
MKLKAQWNAKTNSLGYAADEPGISYSISFLHVLELESMEKYLKVEQMSEPISGSAENAHTLWRIREWQFLAILGKPYTSDDLKLGDIEDEMHGPYVVWQSTEEEKTIILIGYDLY